MSEISLFGEDMPEPEPPQPRKRAAKKAEPKPPRKPTKKELRERAPDVQRRAPEVIPDAEDDELAHVVKLLAESDLLAYDELEKYSDIVEPVISKESREKMKGWRGRYGDHIRLPD